MGTGQQAAPSGAATTQRRRRRTALACLAAALALLIGSPAAAQDLSITSISTTALGNVASGPTGDTTLRINPATGAVTKVSGTGLRVSTHTARSLVTVACGNKSKCDKDPVLVVITTIGTPTNRARALANFTVSTSGATATLASTPTTGSSISFLINPVGQNGTKTFWVGFDLPVAGNETGLPTGPASSSFIVTVSDDKGKDPYSLTGQVTATVFRPITVSLTSNLAFGTISRTFAGNGSVTLDAATGQRTVTGQGVQGMNVPATSRAGYTVNGEGGQVFSVSVPPTFDMTGPGGTITVTTSNTASGQQVLSGTLGNPGSFSFHVGGSFPLTTTTGLGAYSGSYAVTVQYN